MFILNLFNMKNIYLLIILLTFFIINSCINSDNDDNYELNDSILHSYLPLLLSVQDTEGGDLIKGIELCIDITNYSSEIELFDVPVNRNLYTLDVIYPDSVLSFYLEYKLAELNPGVIYNSYDYHPSLNISRIDGIYFLNFQVFCLKHTTWMNEKSYPPADKVIFKLKCPYLFGDNNEHEIVTYWKPDNILEFSRSCYCIEFDGKNISPIIPRLIYSSYFNPHEIPSMYISTLKLSDD